MIAKFVNVVYYIVSVYIAVVMVVALVLSEPQIAIDWWAGFFFVIWLSLLLWRNNMERLGRKRFWKSLGKRSHEYETEN